MATTTNLYKINTTYYFRCRIPADLRQWFAGKEDFKRSLHTKSVIQAKKLIKIWNHKTEEVFTMMRCGFLTPEQIRQLAEQYKQATLKECEENRLEGRYTPKDDNELEAVLGAYEDEESDCREALAFNTYNKVSHLVDSALQAQAIEVSKGSPDYNALCRAFLQKLIEIAQIERERMVGNYQNGFDDLQLSLQPEPHVSPPLPLPQSPLLSEMITKFMADYERNETANANTIKEYQGFCDLLLQIVGDPPVQTITRDDMRNYLDTLKKLPPHMNKRQKYRGKTLAEIIAVNETEDNLSHSAPGP